MKNRVLILNLLTLILAMFCSCATNESVQTNSNPTEHAENLLKRGLYADAEKAFDHIINKDPSNTKAVLGLINLYIETGRDDEATAFLEQQTQARAKPIYYSRLAGIYKGMGKLSESIEQLRLYQSSLPEDHPNIVKAKNEIEQLSYAIDLISNPYDIKIEPLSKDINTSTYSEYQPRFTLDNSEIIFTRKINGQEDLFTATKQDSSYIIKPISAINTRYNEGAQTISGDGRYLIFTHCNDKAGYGSCDLYESIKVNDQWSRPKNIGAPVNTSGWESQPSLNEDGTVLYFASTYANGMGQSDIWTSTRSKAGWSKPENLGSVINTKGRDESPFIHADGRSLYFRSTGHPGIGSYDLYVSTKTNGVWSTPKNMGYPINSIGEERDLVVSLDGLTGYFSSDSFEGNKEHLDIYKFTLPSALAPTPMTYLQCQVLDKDSNEPIEAQILIYDLETNSELVNKNTDVFGRILTALEVSNEISMQISAPGYTFWSEHFSYDQSRYGRNPYSETIYLNKIRANPTTPNELAIDEPIVLKNIFFETGSAALLPASNQEIRFLYDYLKFNTLSIQIIGHTDNVGAESENQVLSQQRAESVRQKLIDLGISPDRILAIGRGELSPIATNETDNGRAQNRRTEVVINK